MNTPVVLVAGALRRIGHAAARVRIFIAYEYPGDVSFALNFEWRRFHE